MNLINLRLSQIEPSTDSEIALRSQSDGVSSNVDSFAEYANSTFTTGGYSNSVVLSESIKYLSSTNANSAYADSNSFVLGSAVNSRDNLLVYLDGILQHTDQYIVEGTSLTLSNTDPLPKDVSVGIRHLQTSNVLVTTSAGANSIAASNGSIAWDYETKRLYVYDGSTIGGYASSIATQSVSYYSMQGELAGYASGGFTTGYVNIIDKFSFTSDSDAIDVGNLTVGKSYMVGNSSKVSGYSTGGFRFPPSTRYGAIEKFSFASDGNATSSASLFQTRSGGSGQSSEFSGYASGGTNASFASVDTIDKFPFSSDTNATDVGELTAAKGDDSGQSSFEFGYSTGQQNGTGLGIQKFPFSSDTNATSVGNLTSSPYVVTGSGQSSSTSGYHTGGSNNSEVIEKFPFSSDTDSTDVGNLSTGRNYLTGQSSVTSGYASGGMTPTLFSAIDKFPFTSDTNSTNVASLTAARQGASGQQI